MRAISEQLNTRLVYHDIAGLTSLSPAWRAHSNPFCSAMKQTHGDAVCRSFCDYRVNFEVLQQRDGTCRTCPYHFIEAVAPVWLDGNLVGILFSGPFLNADHASTPLPGMIAYPPEAIEARRVVISGLARQFEVLLAQTRPHSLPDLPDFYQQLQGFFHHHYDQTTSIKDFADEISLSPSRTQHLIKQKTGHTFSHLLNEYRLTQAAHRLVTTDHQIGKIAHDVGFYDQSHFTRWFRKLYGISPGRYRASRL